jgi:hypothetical protein
MKGGYGSKGKDTLRTVLRDALKVTGLRLDVRIVETTCMGICLKVAVTALDASHPDRIRTIPKGTATDKATAYLMSDAEQYGCPTLSTIAVRLIRLENRHLQHQQHQPPPSQSAEVASDGAA